MFEDGWSKEGLSARDLGMMGVASDTVPEIPGPHRSETGGVDSIYFQEGRARDAKEKLEEGDLLLAEHDLDKSSRILELEGFIFEVKKFLDATDKQPSEYIFRITSRRSTNESMVRSFSEKAFEILRKAGIDVGLVRSALDLDHADNPGS